MGRRVTITDVAASAGVSRTTVSLVLADAPKIPPETKVRVREAMDALGYVYNRAAAAARRGESSLVGLLLTDIRNPFFADLTMALDLVAGADELSVIQSYSFGDAEREAVLARSLAEHMLGALVLLPTPASTKAGLTRAVGSQPLIQLLRTVPGLESDVVGVDNVESGLVLGRHLAGRRPRRTLLVAGYASEQFDQRLAGLAAGLGEPVSAVLGGAPALGAALDVGVPDAVVTYNDTHLLAVLHMLRERGLVPGRDVAVASFDNTHIAQDAAPGITSVDHHAGRLAELTLQLARRRMGGDVGPFETLLVPPTLEVRESTSR